MAQVRAVAFDFDDTLSDWPSAVGRAARLLSNEVPEIAQPGFASRFLDVVWERYPSREPGPLFFEVQSVIEAVLEGTPHAAALADRFRAVLAPVAFPEVHPVLDELAATTRLAVLSNNPYAPEGIRLLGLAHHFDVVIAVHESSGRAKPHPDAFQALTDSLSLRPEDVLYVGDSVTHDIEGALAAGLRAAWLDRFAADRPVVSGAHRIGSLEDLPALLRGL